MEASLGELFRLDGEIALVTGGNKGLGQAIAVALAQAGADVAIVSQSGNMDKTLTAITATGRRALGIKADVGAGDAAHTILSQMQAEIGAPSILVNNAGTIRRAAAAETEISDFMAVLDVNLMGAWRLAQAAGRRMLAQGHGKIINVASLLSFQGGIRVPAYTASKHALAGLTKALANEWAGQGVNVNAIAPGYIATDNTEALRNDPERSRQILERIPAGRWGVAQDIAGAAVFLAAPASAYMHGHILIVDGGWMAR